MARVHPQDSVDVQQAARREARYDCEFVIDAVVPADLSPVSLPYSSKEGGEKAIADKVAEGGDAPLGRLVSAVAELQNVTARLEFGLDDYDRPVVTGAVNASVSLPCQRCLEEVSVALETPLHSVIWLGAEPPSKELALGPADVIVSQTTAVPFAVLVEDDLLLALPDRVCQQDDCPRAPVLTYPASGGDASLDTATQGGQGERKELASDRQLPFAGLRDLLNDDADS